MAKRKNNKCQKFDGFHVNPFIDDTFTIQVNILTDEKTYQTVNGIMQPKQYKFEKQLSSKVFRSAKNRNTIAELKASAQRLWLWITYEVAPSTAEFELNIKTYQKHNPKNSSINTIKDAIKDLTDKKLIKPSDRKNIYFINPVYLFSGNRVKSYPEHVEIYRSE